MERRRCEGARKYTVKMILSFGSRASAGAPVLFLLLAPSLLALLAYVVAAWRVRGGDGMARSSLVVAWLLHALAIVVDATGIGTGVVGARFGFAPALSATLWLVLAVYVVESRFVPLAGVRRTLSILGAIAVVLALAFPGEVRPQAPSPWAPVHWVLGIASYGLFGAAVLHGAMLTMAERRMRSAAGMTSPEPMGLPLLRIEKLTFRFVAAGFVVLSAALMLGWWFSGPWTWDHKAVFSVMGWLVFAALLIGRRVFGWRGRRATSWLYLGCGLLLLGYVGSRFVFEVVLHRVPA
ncbi:cytochrome c biogenesis protein CcsA [soil metagenome]